MSAADILAAHEAHVMAESSKGWQEWPLEGQHRQRWEAMMNAVIKVGHAMKGLVTLYPPDADHMAEALRLAQGSNGGNDPVAFKAAVDLYLGVFRRAVLRETL